MTEEERSKYLLIDIFKNSRFNQVMLENPVVLGLCYRKVKDDVDFMLQIRTTIVQSGEEFDYSIDGAKLILCAIFTNAIYSSISKLHELASVSYSKEVVECLINFLTYETSDFVYKKTLAIFESGDSLVLKDTHTSDDDLAMYKGLYSANVDLLDSLKGVKNEKDYEEVIKCLRW